jgi:N-acetylmuramoyl-L-alanine amidase
MSRPCASRTPENGSTGGVWLSPASVPEPATAPGRDLGPGDGGEDVERFQAALATWGYGLTADGRYGPETRAVVTALQRHWRPRLCDGVADEETRSMLNGLLAAAQR